MAQILQNIQHNFVPAAVVGNQREVLQRVFLDGDQLTEERARMHSKQMFLLIHTMSVWMVLKQLLQIGILERIF